MQFGRIAREGLVAGLLGAAAVAGWFLVVDTVSGQPFFTPALLGQALLGLGDPSTVDVSFPTVVSYTMVHVLAFVVVGIVSALLAFQVERVPATLFVVVVFFAAFEFGFYIIVATMGQPLLGALAWTNVAIGNAIAAFAMGFFLWKAHPRLREELRRQPLGHAAD